MKITSLFKRVFESNEKKKEMSIFEEEIRCMVDLISSGKIPSGWLSLSLKWKWCSMSFNDHHQLTKLVILTMDIYRKVLRKRIDDWLCLIMNKKKREFFFLFNETWHVQKENSFNNLQLFFGKEIIFLWIVLLFS